MRQTKAIILSLIIALFSAGAAMAADSAPKAEVAKTAACPGASDRNCVKQSLRAAADAIENIAWRDQTYRELAKTMAFDGDTDEAIALVDKIQTPDTKAMTIRGIAMTVADNRLTKDQYAPIFQKLRDSAEKISDPPSYAIALTYIAMGQAFAGDNDGAWKTASDMKNDALQHKAFGETAEIQAEQGHPDLAMKSIGMIASPSYQDKSHTTVAEILADHGMLDDALKSAEAVRDPYKRSEALQYVLDKQKPREVPHEEANKLEIDR